MHTTAEAEPKTGTGPTPRPGKNDLREVLLLALSHHREGRVQDAERIYRRVLEADPEQPDALRLLGTLALDRRDFAEAIRFLERAAAVAPQTEAIVTTLAQARFSAAKALYDGGQYTEALNNFHDLVKQTPGHGPSWFYLGVIAHLRGAATTAIRAYRHALEVGLDTAELHTNLGTAFAQIGQTADAVVHQERAVALAPEAADLHINLATALAANAQWGRAVASCHEALRLAPNNAAAYSVLGTVRMRQGQPQEALVAHGRALALATDTPGTLPAVLNDYANARMDIGDIDGALALYADAVARAAGMAEVHFHQSLALLSAGRLEEGWAAYEWRWQLAGRALPIPLQQGRWQGNALPEQTLVLWREQGLGDELMFASCIPEAVASGARLVVACTPRLRSLLARSFPTVTVIDDHQLTLADLRGAAAHAPFGDLARWYRPDLRAFPARAGFLQAEPSRVSHWRRQLGEMSGPVIGLCWRSGLLTPSRRGGYAALTDWEAVLRTPRATFVSLQYDDCAAEVEEVQRKLGVKVHQFSDIDLRNDLDETAALMSALDLVISAPTAVGELAGALGIPTWRVTSGRDWTMLGTDQRPWFPTMRVFARDVAESWHALLARVATAIRTAYPSGRRSAPVPSAPHS